MRRSGFFQSVSFLPIIGMVRAKQHERSVFVFKDGRIIVNCVKDSDDARRILGIVANILTEDFSATLH